MILRKPNGEETDIDLYSILSLSDNDRATVIQYSVHLLPASLIKQALNFIIGGNKTENLNAASISLDTAQQVRLVDALFAKDNSLSPSLFCRAANVIKDLPDSNITQIGNHLSRTYGDHPILGKYFLDRNNTPENFPKLLNILTSVNFSALAKSDQEKIKNWIEAEEETEEEQVNPIIAEIEALAKELEVPVPELELPEETREQPAAESATNGVLMLHKVGGTSRKLDKRNITRRNSSLTLQQLYNNEFGSETPLVFFDPSDQTELDPGASIQNLLSERHFPKGVLAAVAA